VFILPIIVYKKEIQVDDYKENIHIAFDCGYDEFGHLYLKNYEPNYFDSGDFRLKIDETAKKFSKELLKKYDEKNNGVLYLAILNYFLDEIPSIYSIKFESFDGCSIYYRSDLKR